jgi:hypothetical protein
MYASAIPKSEFVHPAGHEVCLREEMARHMFIVAPRRSQSWVFIGRPYGDWCRKGKITHVRLSKVDIRFREEDFKWIRSESAEQAQVCFSVSHSHTRFLYATEVKPFCLQCRKILRRRSLSIKVGPVTLRSAPVQTVGGPVLN